jgi:hypothetical protein
MVCSVTARPWSGSNSCRFTPRNSTRRPFTVRIPPVTATVRKPIRSGTVSPAAASAPSYSRGDSADHGSTVGTITVSPAAASIPSSGTVTRAGMSGPASTSASTRSVPRPVRWS